MKNSVEKTLAENPVPEGQMAKIFGIGWAKTGTTTLGNCFKILGYNHQGQDLDLVKDLTNGTLNRIMEIANKKESFEDWPWILLFKELDEAFPGSKFVLTKRISANWVRSYLNMIANQGEAPEELNQVRRAIYGLNFPHVSAAQLIERYEAHNSDVERYFQHRSDDLLVVDWEEGDGWKELCDFLGKEIPGEPFPHANKGKYQGSSIP